MPSNRLGLTYGLFSTTISLAVPAPAIGAQLWQNKSPQLPFYLTAAVSLVMVVPIWLKLKAPAGDGAAVDDPAGTETVAAD